MSYDAAELNLLEKEIENSLTDRLSERLIFLNRTGEIDAFLEMLGIGQIDENLPRKRERAGKIAVIGISSAGRRELTAIGESLGIDKRRFDFCLTEKELKRYNFGKLQWTDKYALVLAGPMPHHLKGDEKAMYRSKLSVIETEPGYPPVIRLGKNELKISKTGFRDALSECLEKGLIE